MLKKVILIISSVIVVLVFVMLGLPTQTNLEKLETGYIKEWVDVFTKYDSPKKFSQINESLRPELIVYRKFPDDSWIAAVCAPLVEWHYSATVVIDSNGDIKSSRKDLSGYETLYSIIHNNKADSIQKLYEIMSDFQWVTEKSLTRHSSSTAP